jgi:hypothetical protein
MIDPKIQEDDYESALQEIENIQKMIKDGYFENNENRQILSFKNNDYLNDIAERLKEHDSNLYELLYNINDNKTFIYNYILEAKYEILRGKSIKIFKTNEYIVMFCNDYEIMGPLIVNYCSYKNLPIIKKYCTNLMNPNNKNYEKFIIHIAIYIDPNYFELLPKNITDNDELMLIAINHHEKALQYSSFNIKNNIKIIEKFLLNKVDCYQYSGENIKKNYKLSFLALKINENNINYVHDDLFKNKNFIIEYYNLKYNNIYQYIDLSLLNDIDIINEAINNDDNVDLILVKNPNLQNDEIMIEKMINYSNNSMIIKYSNKNIKNNEKICTLAIKKNYKSFEYISNELKQDEKFIKKILCLPCFSFSEYMENIFDIDDIYIKNYEKCEKCEEEREEKINGEFACEKCIQILTFILNECKNDKIKKTIKDDYNCKLYNLDKKILL